MLTKSKDRVANFGEVFTSQKIVNAMLNLVQDETQRIESRFLEPACGDGNFLAEVLCRKLEIVKMKYKENQLDFERYAFQAVASVYGVEKLKDNVIDCRKRLLDILVNMYSCLYKTSVKNQFIEAIDFVLSRNIIWGDALSLKELNEEKPLVFSEWSFVKGSMVQRTDYTFDELLASQSMGEETLFPDSEIPLIMPKPREKFPLIHFLGVSNVS